MRLTLATVTLTALVASGLATPRPAAAEPVSPKTIPILVSDNGSGIAAKDLAAAQATTARILGHIGVTVVWLTLEDLDRDLPADSAIATDRYRSLIYLVVANHAQADAVSGNRFAMGKAASGGRTIWAFPSRLVAIAARTPFSIGDLLGHVIAHELGHLLLGRGAHAPWGLMRASLDLEGLRAGRLWFTASEARTIHETLARR